MRPFLTAQWRHLAMLNYRVDPALLEPLVPAGTTLDSWRGAYFVSIVGFRFLDTRVLGIPIPFHRNFEEVNLRFYVRRTVAGDVRRGVVFVRELVPRMAIAVVARLMYNEPYQSLPMKHRIERGRGAPDEPSLVEYSWRLRSGWSRVRVEPVGPSAPLMRGSEEEFITEHYWGYTRQRDGGTLEYRVVHPPWRVWQVPEGRASVSGSLEELYAAGFAKALAAPPDSAFLADGSAIQVYRPTRIA